TNCTDLLAWPFPLPSHFADQLGYERAAGPVVMPESVREVLRRANVTDAEIAVTEHSLATRRPRRWLALWWEPAGDELAFRDGVASGAGRPDHWPYLGYMDDRQIHAWLIEHQVDLGSSEEPATHALVVDRDTDRAWVAPMPLASAIVRDQHLPVGRARWPR